MVDRAELRKMAEAATPGPWWRDNSDAQVWAVSQGPLRASYPITTDCHYEDAAFIAAASPDVVLGLLDEIERLTQDNKLKYGDGYEAAGIALVGERDQLRAALEAIATHNPAVTHGWAEQVREMARDALGGEPITDYRAVAVRMKGYLENIQGNTRQDVVRWDCETALADPEVEKL